MSKPIKILSDLKKIIQIQEKIIKTKESELMQVNNLLEHYLDKSHTYAWWYTKYRYFSDAFIDLLKNQHGELYNSGKKNYLAELADELQNDLEDASVSPQTIEKQLSFKFGGDNE